MSPALQSRRLSEPDLDTMTDGGDQRPTSLPRPPTLPPRWQPVRLLGRGGQGEVWLVEDLATSELVALKILTEETSPATRERLRREVRVGRSLQHPGLIRVHDLHEDDDHLMVAMEYLPGGSLADRVAAGPLPVDEVVDIARQALEVLAYLHAQRVVHRDVKPSNLLLDGDGRVKLADLGLARPLDEVVSLTRSGAAPGTLAYMSHEQLLGRESGPPCDLFALGVTLYELLTGTRPPRVETQTSATEAFGVSPPPPLQAERPDCPAWFGRFLGRLLEPAAADRYPDAGAALAALDARRARLAPRVWRRRLALAGLGLATAATAVVAVATGGRELATASFEGPTVVAVDERGRAMWRHQAEGPVTGVVVADLIGDGAQELAVGSLEPRGEEGRTGRVEVFDQERQSVMRTVVASVGAPDLRDEVGDIQFRRVETQPGQPALVWIGLHATAYPAVLGLFDGRGGLPPAPLLYNSGHLHVVRSADLFGDERAELVVTGINNPLGFQAVVAVLEMAPGVRNDRLQSWVSPDQVVTAAGYRRSGQQSVIYVPLGQSVGDLEIRAAGRDGIVVATRAGELRLDVHGNPSSSPLYGRGPDARLTAWDELADLCADLETANDASGRSWSAVAERHRVVLAEPPMRVAAALLVARSLARAGRHREAIALLEAARASDPEVGDLGLRLAEQLIIVGEGEQGSALLLAGRRPGGQGRPPSDEPFDVVLSAAHRGDEASMRAALAWLDPDGLGMNHVITAGAWATWAFCRGQWHEAALDPHEARAGSPTPDVLRAWAALERGESSPAAAAQRAAALARDPEVRPLARLLAAAAALAAGEPERAAGLAAEAQMTLDRRARVEVEAFVWRGLAERLLAEAATADGNAGVAAEHLARAQELAPHCWFGQGRFDATAMVGTRLGH